MELYNNEENMPEKKITKYKMIETPFENFLKPLEKKN